MFNACFANHSNESQHEAAITKLFGVPESSVSVLKIQNGKFLKAGRLSFDCVKHSHLMLVNSQLPALTKTHIDNDL